MNKSDKKKLRTGYTTGVCATAATVAALELLLNGNKIDIAVVELPAKELAEIEICDSSVINDSAQASVRKDAGDDPDVTDGVIIKVAVKLNNLEKIRFMSGSGVGTVTKPGLQVPVGEPAINPVPREMMRKAVAGITGKGVDITISAEGGEELAAKTFNPRLGIVGGISIIGTSGIVRPFSHEAIAETVKVNIDVAVAGGASRLVMVAGHYGRRAASDLFAVRDNEIIEVSNEWGTALEQAVKYGVANILLLSHPGKLAKFIDNHFNTHSSFSPSALPGVKRIAAELNIAVSEEIVAVDGLFSEISAEDRLKLGNHLAEKIYKAVQQKFAVNGLAVTLIGMKLNELGSFPADSDNTEKDAAWERK